MLLRVDGRYANGDSRFRVPRCFDNNINQKFGNDGSVLNRNALPPFTKAPVALTELSAITISSSAYPAAANALAARSASKSQRGVTSRIGVRIVCAVNANRPVCVLREERVVIYMGSGINFVLDRSRVWDPRQLPLQLFWLVMNVAAKLPLL